MTKFQAAENTLKAIHPDFMLDDFGIDVAGFFITFPQTESNQKYGRRKAVLVTRAKKALEKHGYINFHEWRGESLQIEANIYWI